MFLIYFKSRFLFHYHLKFTHFLLKKIPLLNFLDRGDFRNVDVDDDDDGVLKDKNQYTSCIL